MSQFRHIILVFFLIFANYQFANSEDVLKPLETDTAKFSSSDKNGSLLKPPEPDIAKPSLSGKNRSLTVKISVEKAECVNDRISVAETTTSTATAVPIPAGLNAPEAGSKLLGSPKNPAKSCSDLEGSDNYFINTSTDPIKVACDDKNKTTCLIVKERIEEERALTSTAITLGKELWLSQTSFDMKSLYNKVDGPTGTDILQISHLLSTSVKVSQTIRYYYSEGNSTTAEDTIVTSLQALLWNDHLVGSKITKQMPIAFRVGETKPCWEENTEGWMCTEITFDATSTNRLPVRDFYIQDVRKSEKVQKLYFELVDLCFYYK